MDNLMNAVLAGEGVRGDERFILRLKCSPLLLNNLKLSNTLRSYEPTGIDDEGNTLSMLQSLLQGAQDLLVARPRRLKRLRNLRLHRHALSRDIQSQMP